MASVKQLESQVQELTQLLDRVGIRLPSKAAEAEEFIGVKIGSDEHMAFLGLIQVENVKEAEEDYGHIVYRSPKSDKTYRLENQVTPFMTFSDPMQVARLVLAQKVSSFESGPVKVPADAPPLWRGDLMRV